MAVKSVGEIEAAAAVCVCRLAKEAHGCGAKDVRSHLLDDRLFVILEGVMTGPQQRLASTATTTCAEYKACLRRYRAEVWHLCEHALRAAILDITGRQALAVLCDFCPETGDEFLFIRLESRPETRPSRA